MIVSFSKITSKYKYIYNNIYLYLEEKIADIGGVS